MTASLVILLMPGPAVLYVVARSVRQGHRAGLVSVLGLSTGALVQLAAATLGLSALLLASAAAFSVVKALGAAYLIYLGIRTLLTSQAPEVAGTRARPWLRLFRDGVVVNALNPKIAIFFLAFLPQFVERGRGAIPQQVLLLGLIYVTLALVTDGAYALLGAHVRRWLGNGVLRSPLPRYASGAVYIGLGASTAFVERK